MSVKNLRLSVALLVCALGVARSTSADPVVIYSNFGPPPGYMLPGWQDVYDDRYYMGFQLVASAQLTSVMLPVRWADELPAGLSVWLYSSNGGAPDFSGTRLIERLVAPLPAGAQPSTVSMVTLTSSLQPMLSADTLYFLGRVIIGPTNTLSGASISWPMNNAGIQGLVVNAAPMGESIRTTISQGTLGAFQLNGEPSPVPEPSTMLMFASGAGLVMQRARRRRISG